MTGEGLEQDMRVSEIDEIQVIALRDGPDAPGAVKISCLIRDPDLPKLQLVEAEVTLNVEYARELEGKVGAALRLLEGRRIVVTYRPPLMGTWEDYPPVAPQVVGLLSYAVDPTPGHDLATKIRRGRGG